jgi:pyruvate carboxylase subunit B
MSTIDTGVLSHQIPGGMFSNMVAQLRQADALNRLPEVYEELPRTRRELGYPPLVTPTSQIVGTQAVLNVLFGRYKMIANEVKDYVYGLYGRPPAAVDPDVQKLALAGYPRGTEPFTGRAADLLAPELAKAEEDTKGLARDIGDVLCYALYPTTGLRFLKWKYGVEAPPPDTMPKTLEDVRREDERVAKARKELPADPTPAAGVQPTSQAPRQFTVRVAGETFQVEVTADAAGAPSPAAPMSDPAAAASPDSVVAAPMPGLVLRYLVAAGDLVRVGDPVVLVEAMKMQNNLPAPRDGRVAKLMFSAGDNVNRGDVLLTLE